MWPRLALTTQNTVKDALSPSSSCLHLLNAGITVSTHHVYTALRIEPRAWQTSTTYWAIPGPHLYVWIMFACDMKGAHSVKVWFSPSWAVLFQTVGDPVQDCWTAGCLWRFKPVYFRKEVSILPPQAGTSVSTLRPWHCLLAGLLAASLWASSLCSHMDREDAYILFHPAMVPTEIIPRFWEAELEDFWKL